MAGVAETAKLIASLELKDKMTAGVGKAIGSIGKLEGSLNRLGGIAQRGVSNAITNVTRLGIVAAGAVAGAVTLGIRSLGDLARTTEQTNAVIASTGGQAGVSAAGVRSLAEELETLSTVDDKVIQDGENMLLTFTGIGKDIFPRATKAALNMAVAMAGGNVEAVDLKASSIQLGKALNDPVKGITALRKVGVAFTDAQVKQIKVLVESGDVLGAQTIILKELETEFGNAAEAAGKGPEASWRRLQDVGEDLSQSLARGLLPVLTRAADWLSTKLADPAVIKRIDELSIGLGQAGDKLLAFIEKVDFGSIADSLGTAAGFAGDVVGAFMGMPDWIKTAVLTGWGLNKLTGGAVLDLGKLVVDQFAGRGATPANPLFVADVAGGLGGKGGVPGGLSGVQKMFLVGEAIGLGLLVNGVREDQANKNTERATELQAQLQTWFATQPTAAELRNGLAGVEQGIRDIESNPLNVLVQGDALEKLKQMRDDINKQLAEQVGPSKLLPYGPSTQMPRVATSGIAASFKQRRDLDSAAILQRALLMGRKPKDMDAAVQATLQRNIAREQERTKAAVDAVKAEAARTTAAAQATAFAIRDKVFTAPTVRVTANTYVTSTDVQRAAARRKRIAKPSGSRGAWFEMNG